MQNKYKELINNTAIFALSNVLSKIVLALLLPLYTHILTTEEYGTAEIITTISQLLMPVCSLAISEAIYRFSMDKKEHCGEVLKNGFIIAGMGSIFILCISLVLGNYYIVAKWNLLLFGITVTSLFRSILSLYTQAVGNSKLFSIDNVLYNFMLAFMNVFFLAVFKFGLLGYFLAMIFSATMSCIFLIWKQKLLRELVLCQANIRLLKKMLLYSFPMILNAISWSITNLVDKTMLADICGTSATGVYSAASKIPSILSLLANVFAQAWGLSAIKDFENEKDKVFFSKVFIFSHIAVGLGALFVYLVNNNIIKFVLGEEFSSAIIYTPILILGMIFLSYSNFFTPFFQAAKKTKTIMITSIEGSVINVVLNYFLIKEIGIFGACIATLASYMYIALARYYRSREILPINFDSIKFLFSLLLLCVATVVTICGKYVEIMCLLIILIFVFMYYEHISNMVEKLVKRRK